MVPTLLPRTDGRCLLYPGKLHSFHGESESGKSLVLLWEAVRLAAQGESTLWVDFDSDPAETVTRMRAMGKTDGSNFVYVRPDDRPRGEKDAELLFGTRHSLIVLDGVTDAMSLFGYSITDNDDFSKFARLLLRPLAEKTGAAVVIVDHVTKDKDNRGRFAIGAQSKMSILTGASYLVEVVSLVAVGVRGEISIRVGKDRPSGVRPYSGGWRQRDRTQEAARVVVDARGGKTVLAVEPSSVPVDPFQGIGQPAGEHEERAEIERAILAFVAGESNGASQRQVRAAVQGKAQTIREILDQLVVQGGLLASPGGRGGGIRYVVPVGEDEDQTTGETSN